MQALWILVSSFLFAFMGVCVKLASDLYSTAEIIMYRGIIGMFVMVALVLHLHGTLKTKFAWEHFLRGLIGVTSLSFWFFAFSKLPLATAMTLNYMAPIWMAAILFIVAWRRQQSRFEWTLPGAIIMSSIGMVLLLQPSIAANQWLGAAAGIGSGILSAFAYLQVRKLGRLGEPEYRVVFYFSAINLATGLIGIIGLAAISPSHSIQALWHAHTPRGVLLLLAMGVSATVAQVVMTRAYRYGNPLVAANLQYSGIIFSSVWGIVIWNDVLGWKSWLGMAVILVSGIAATFYNAHNQELTNSPKKVAPPSDPIATEI